MSGAPLLGNGSWPTIATIGAANRQPERHSHRDRGSRGNERSPDQPDRHLRALSQRDHEESGDGQQRPRKQPASAHGESGPADQFRQRPLYRLPMSRLSITISSRGWSHRSFRLGRRRQRDDPLVSASGRDSASGRSADHAWRTIRRVNDARLQPGDTVLFQGGATFTDTTLTPGTSGVVGNPISYGSYGVGDATISNGDGAVWFSGRDYLTFQNLRLTTGNANGVIFAGSSGRSTHIVLRNSILFDSNYAAINQPGSDDASWLIRGNVIHHVGDSAMILAGSRGRGPRQHDQGRRLEPRARLRKARNLRQGCRHPHRRQHDLRRSQRQRYFVALAERHRRGEHDQRWPDCVWILRRAVEFGTTVISGNPTRGITRAAFY